MEFKGRGVERIKSDSLIAFVVKDETGNNVFQGMARAMDISHSGVALELQAELETGQKIEMDMGMGEEVVHVSGIIKNVAPIDKQNFHVGVEFDFLTEEDLNRIAMVYPAILK